MRKLLVSLAAAGTVLAFAAPASAQWAPRPGYGAGAARWQNELQQIRMQRNELARSGRLSRYEMFDLDRDIRDTERSIYLSSRGGIGPRQAQNLDGRIWHLRNELRRYADRDGRRWNRGDHRSDRDDHNWRH